MPDSKTNSIRAVERTFELLEALHQKGTAGVTELANEVGVAKSTVHSHLMTLKQMGYVLNNHGEYQLSYRFLMLGGARRDSNPFFRMSKEHVDELAEETGDIAAATTEEDGENVYLYVSNGKHAVKMDIQLGTRLPLHCLASGKAILSMLPDARVEQIVDEKGLPPRTSNTITGHDRLFEELEKIRSRGFAFDNEERIEGMRAVAAPVRNESKDTVLGAIVVSGSTNRVKGDYFREELPELVTRRAREIEINATYS